MHFQYIWKKYLNFQTQCEKTRASVPHDFEKNFAPCNIKCYCNTQAKSNRFDSKAEFSVISVWAIVCDNISTTKWNTKIILEECLLILRKIIIKITENMDDKIKLLKTI